MNDNPSDEELGAEFDQLLAEDPVKLRQRWINGRKTIAHYMEAAEKSAVDSLALALAQDKFDQKIYPCTIMPARYGGTYEGSRWLAFHCDPEEVPEAASGSDVPCAAWHDLNGHLLGHGATPSQAVANLADKISQGLIPDRRGTSTSTIRQPLTCRFCSRPLTEVAPDVYHSNRKIDPHHCHTRDPSRPERQLPHEPQLDWHHVPAQGFAPLPPESSEDWNLYHNDGTRRTYNQLQSWDKYRYKPGDDGYPVEMTYAEMMESLDVKIQAKIAAEDAADAELLAQTDE